MSNDKKSPKAQIVEAINRIYAKKMTTTSGGNLSIKYGENIYITPSGKDKGSLEDNDIACVYKDGSTDGRLKPSCELPFHSLVYKTRPDIKAVVHAHPHSMVSFSLTRTLPKTDLTSKMKSVVGEIGSVDYFIPGSIELGEAIAAELAKGKNVVEMASHGVVAVGSTMEEAFMRFENTEYAGNLNILSRALSNKPLLSSSSCGFSLTAGNKKGADFAEKYEKLIEEIISFSKRSYRQDLFIFGIGTIALRTSEGFLVSKDGVDTLNISKEDVLFYNGQLNGSGLANVELLANIFNQNEEINSVFMAAPPNIMAFSVTETPIASLTIPESYIMMRNLQRTSEQTSASEIAAKFSSMSPVLLVENNCVIATGNSLIQAFDRLEVTDFTASTIIKAINIGNTYNISQNDVEAINKAFNIK